MAVSSDPSDGDEIFSLRAATVITVLIALVTLMASLVGIDPFTEIFNLLIVYTPALALSGALTHYWLKKR